VKRAAAYARVSTDRQE
jgi:site-specific DNA recombinase